MHTGFLSVEDTDKEQSKLLKELNDLNKGDKPFENKPFLKSVGFLFDVREKVLNSFKSDIFPIKNLGKIPTPKEIPNSKLEPTLNPAVFDTPKITKAQTKKSKHMTSPLQLRENFVNMVVNDKKTKIMKNSGNILDIRIHYFCQNIQIKITKLKVSNDEMILIKIKILKIEILIKKLILLKRPLTLKNNRKVKNSSKY